MQQAVYKSKHLFFVLAKTLLVCTIVYFIYDKIASSPFHFNKNLKDLLPENPILLVFVLGLFTSANWILEVFKWKNLVQNFKEISFLKAFKEVFFSHSISVLTPNRLGEYGAKPLFYKRKMLKKIIFLSFFGNMSQLLATIIFGCIGLVLIAENLTLNFPSFGVVHLGLALLIVLLVFIGILKRKFLLKKLQQLSKSRKKMNSQLQLKVIGLSVLRYLIFSHQFYFLLMAFQVEIDYFSAMGCITSMYLFSSGLPSILFFDAVIKGGIAIYLFSFFGVSEVSILGITLIMWIFNFGLPALLGSYFVIKFKTAKDSFLREMIWR